jgi:Transposase domain (DUF772)
VLLKIYIYGYLNQVQSSRRLEREAQRNVELMWLTGRLAPDFKTIAGQRRFGLASAVVQGCSGRCGCERPLLAIIAGSLSTPASAGVPPAPDPQPALRGYNRLRAHQRLCRSRRAFGSAERIGGRTDPSAGSTRTAPSSALEFIRSHSSMFRPSPTVFSRGCQ